MNGIFGDANYRRYPYRGILAEIAHEDGVTRQAIQKAAQRGKPDIILRIIGKVEQRRRDLERLQQMLRE